MQAKLYEDVVVEKNGNVFQGEVVSHLSLEDWGSLHGYKIIDYSGYVPAHMFERTHIHPRRITSGPYRFPSDIAILLKSMRA